jgi:hypothetical protein
MIEIGENWAVGYMGKQRDQLSMLCESYLSDMYVEMFSGNSDV